MDGASTSPPSIGSFVMSVVGVSSRSYPFAPTCWILIGVDFPIEFPSTFHSTYRPPPGASKPDASITPPLSRSQMSGDAFGVKGPAGFVAVAIPMQWSLLGPVLRRAVSAGAQVWSGQLGLGDTSGKHSFAGPRSRPRRRNGRTHST